MASQALAQSRQTSAQMRQCDIDVCLEHSSAQALQI
jgi:hypothetical protein